jgi:hypothetical protein
MAKMLRWIENSKIDFLDIDSILNWIILGLDKMKVLDFASPKWVHMLKLVEKWLCNTRKYISVACGAILNYSSILKFWKNVLLQYFFYELMFLNPKFQLILLKIDWIMDHSLLAAILNFSSILQCYYTKFLFSIYGLGYQIMSLHQL